MKHLILFILLLLEQEIIDAQVSASALSVPYGKYEIGFKHYVRNDGTRSYKRLNDFTEQILPRPIPISIWFPAIPEAEQNL